MTVVIVWWVKIKAWEPADSAVIINIMGGNLLTQQFIYYKMTV